MRRVRIVVPAAIVLLAAVACGSTSAAAHGTPTTALISPGAPAPISTGPEEVVSVRGMQLWRLSGDEMVYLSPRLEGPGVRLEPGATVGLVFLGPPSDAYVVISNPSDEHDTGRGSYRPATPGAVVFATPGLMFNATSPGLEDLHLKLGVLRINLAGLYLYDELDDPACPLRAHTDLAVLATDSRMGMLVRVLNNGMEVGDRGWLPVKRTGKAFLVLKPPTSLPSGRGC